MFVQKRSLLLLFLLVFCSRLPFLNAGYGIEEDSWGIALAAYHTKLNGIYEPSRFPGHPGQEYLLSALWGAGPWVFNLLSALFSAIATVAFAGILQQLRFRFVFLLALTFAFVPVFYISSTYTIDFVWTAAFVLLSLLLLLKEKWIAAGILLGLAVSCRITSGAMLLPFLLLIWDRTQLKVTLLRLLKVAVPMLLVAMLFFLPVVLQYGSSFFMYYDQFPYPSFAKVFYKMIPGVFGALGTLVLGGFAFVVLLKKQSRGELFSNGFDQRLIWASVSVLLLYSISYFRLPQKSGYMIPVIPFVLLLFGYLLNHRQFYVFCGGLLLSSFVFSINLTDERRGAEYSSLALKYTVSGQELFLDPLSGPVFSDLSKRKQKARYVKTVMEACTNADSAMVIIAGWWYNQIMVEGLEDSKKNNHVIYEAYIPEKKLIKYRDAGYHIYFLPEQDRYNDMMFGMQVTNQFALSFPY